LRLKWTRPASQDLDDIAEFIGQDSPAAAARVILELIECVESTLPFAPASGRPGRLLGTRELVIGNLPYVIAYRVNGSSVEILRVLHTSRRWPSDI
jgi:toxin ParE1/3/4